MTDPTSSASPSAGHLLSIGLGYCATALSKRLAPRGFSISGTTRSASGREAIERQGWQGLVWTGGSPTVEMGTALGEATHLLLSAAPDEAGDPVLPHVADILGRSRNLAWIGYLSTVGVYGDRAGGWVDETTPIAPAGVRSRRRAEAETQWLELGQKLGCRAQIFRLPGIYGPGRSAIDQMRAGTARRIVKPGQVFNRIHVDDIARALEAAIVSSTASPIYNLADDEPAPADEVVAYAAELLGMTPPPAIDFATATLSPMAAGFYAETKRVSNRLMKAELITSLTYPTYREGLHAIASEDR
jgi:nucleoside-diphosphate-sugar epimerase